MSIVEEQILNASDIIVNNAIQKAGYDKTIQAQVISCEDATIGKYKCRHQDSTFYAYSNNTDLTYTNGAYVYIHVPGNDMSKQKTILGTTNKLGINYISQAIGDQAYNIIGNNCISLKEEESTFYLYTNKEVRYSEVIYEIDENGEDEIGKINLDKEALKQSIQQSSSLIIGATIKTSIEPQRQSSRGHYGITYKLKFLNNNSNESIFRTYTIDEDNMIGNPYRLVYPTRQYQIFDIDGPNFVQVVSIQIFNENFPNPNLENEDKADIEITKLQLNGAIRMSESELNGVAISFYTPQGLFFTESSEDGDYKKITAQVRIKGKLASAAQKIPFYWGKEHIGITSKNVKYNKYLGRGWQCLNDSNVITQKDEDNNIDPVVQWVPGGDTYIVKYEKSLPRNNRFKVAIIYDNNVISKQINIQNLAPSAPEVILESSDGTQFYFDSGETILSCIVTQQDKTSTEKKIQNGGENAKNFIYYWGYVDPNGAFFQLENTEKTYNVKISDISLFRNYKCSVYKKPTEENADFVYLGTAQITISNSLQAEGLYHLVIENGDMVFQYNENGIAPTNKSVDSPQALNDLSFTLYDNTGHPIDAKTIIDSKDCEVTWEFPIGNDTLLIDKNGAIDNPTEKEYHYYKKIEKLTYDIAPQYNIKKQRNQIKLTVNYKGMIISKETAFTFVKQGQPGTNGTQYIVRIVPDSENQPVYPMITKVGTNNNFDFNFSYNKNLQPFKVQLWKSGELVWDGYSEQNGTLYNDFKEKPTKITWDVLNNKLQKDSSSLFTINNTLEGYSLKINNDKFKKDDFLNKKYANIIKCSIIIKDKTYYGTLPIIAAWVRNEGYVAKLKDYSGFRHVIYTSDGIKPQYDSSSPFEFIFESDDFDEEKMQKIQYKEGVIGNLLTPIESELRRKGYQDNQWDYQPASQYNGESVTEAVTCEYIYPNEQGGKDTIAMIHIPIHFLLNKYGLSHLNDWDGNSIEINNDGGYILSPQMGAGSKGSDNTFTGILMGEVKTPSKDNPDIGLLGYAGGARTLFLNSQTGSAMFGKAGKGQIVIDPSTVDRGLIYSGNFWDNKFYNSSTGLPDFDKNYSHDEFYKNYRNDKFVPNENNTQKSGLLIDLTAPEIYFGTGNFYVTNQGYLHAAGGGDIAGWKIGENELTGGKTGGDLHLVSSGQIYSNDHKELENTNNGFYLSADGLSIGSKVKITKDGTAYFGKGAVDGKSSNHWTIDSNDKNSYIAYSGSSFHDANPYESSDILDPAKVYIGTDGISLGNRFSINTNGDISAKGGLIGGWQIGSNSIFAGEWDRDKHYFPEEKIRLKLNSNGSMQGGNSYKWSISQNGEAKFNRLIADSSGSIAGWTISENGLSSSTGNMKINKDGSMSGGTNPNNSNSPGWTITSNGVATFANTFNVTSNFYFTGTGSFGSGSRGGGGGSLTGGGTSFGSGGLAMNSDTTTIGGKNVQGIFNSITSDIATINTLTSKVITTDNLYSKIADMRTVSIKNLIVNNRNVDARFKSIENSIDRIWAAINNLKPSA